MNDAGTVAAVCAADQKEDVRVYALNRLQIILRQFKRKLPDNLCARAETCQPCSLHRQLRHKSADHHPPAAEEQANDCANVNGPVCASSASSAF